MTSRVTYPEVLEKVRAICVEVLELPLELVTENADFQADLGVDSLTMSELLERVLRHYGKEDEFHDADTNTYNTVADLARFVAGLLRTDDPAPYRQR
jgi:[acyl-carrier-protein] S-malonyltransferase